MAIKCAYRVQRGNCNCYSQGASATLDRRNNAYAVDDSYVSIVNKAAGRSSESQPSANRKESARTAAPPGRETGQVRRKDGGRERDRGPVGGAVVPSAVGAKEKLQCFVPPHEESRTLYSKAGTAKEIK